MFSLAISCLTMSSLSWPMDLTSGSYAILFFTALGFTFITRHIWNWVLLPLWPSRFILSGAIGSCPLLFWRSILDSFQPILGLIFQCHIFFSFYVVRGVLMANILGWFAIPSTRGSRFVRTLHYDSSVLDGPAWHGSLLHGVMQTPSPWQGSDPWKGDQANNIYFT